MPGSRICCCIEVFFVYLCVYYRIVFTCTFLRQHQSVYGSCPARFVLLHAVTRSCFLSQSIDDDDDDDDDDDVDDDSIFVLNIF